ncbi:MAG: NADH-quinone oxidoreductase subunit L [Gammaproteobacteria bacterium]|nr:NADH-quinone oxidoreductase subunit L [Gammaproteobacteria bacterium]
MLWLLPLTPIAAACVVAAAGRLRSRRALAAVGTTVVLLTLLIAAAAAAGGWSGAALWSRAIELRIGLSPLAQIVAVTLPAVALPIVAYASAHEPEFGLRRLIALLLAFVGAMELLVAAEDLLTLLIGWELVGACSWALIGHDWRDGQSPRAATHAFLVTRFGDLGLFIAAAAAFAGTGSFAYADLAALQGPLLGVFVLGIVAAACAKSAQLPFAFWLFRAMAGPTSVSALLHAAAMVAAGAYLLARLNPDLSRADWFGPTIVAIGAATALAGGLVAVLQSHAKKLLAASTSAHFGLMLIAAGAGHPAVAIAHLVTHAFFKALLFLASGVAGEAVGSYMLRNMALRQALPVTAGLTFAGTLALAGVPPLGGAWSKEAVAAAAADAGHAASAAVIVAGALSACYAFRFQWLAFGRRPEERKGDAEGGEDEHAGSDEQRARMTHPKIVEMPSATELTALGLLAAATIALSLLWLAPVESSFGRLLDSSFPHASPAEIAASLVAVALGIYTARVLNAAPTLLEHRAPAALAEWFALPTLLRSAVVRPATRLSRSLARFDDAVIDRLPEAPAAAFRLASRGMSRLDGAVVDRGVRAAAGLSLWLARSGTRFVEPATDGLPEGTAWLLGAAGGDARRAQTGLSHHYYALIAGGVLVMVLILIAAS